MEETNDNEMDVIVNSGDVSDNIYSDQSTQSSENSSKNVQLSEMPKEMLEEILIYLDDRSLLIASHVCRLFASVAETAFARKYSKECYRINYNWDSNDTKKSFDKVMLNKYGGKIREIEIDDDDEEILHLVEQKCDSLKSLKIGGVSRIIMLKDLKEISLSSVHGLERDTFAECIKLNPQLETLELNFIDVNLLDMLDGRLNNLKTLKYKRAIDVDIFLQTKINLNSLDTLHLGLKDMADYIRLLQSMNCNQIKKLVLMKHSDPNENADDDVVNEICKFKTLVSLDLPLNRITSDQVRKLAAHLPHLSDFIVRIGDGAPRLVEAILSITSMFPKLAKLKIQLRKGDFDRLSEDLKRSGNDFYARLAKSNTEIKLTHHRYFAYYNNNMMSITTDHLFLFQEYSAELHWMDNLNEKNVRKVLSSRRSAKEIKFVNNCTDCTFDISALALRHTKCLDFKSNGAISVNSNVSRYQTWFPCLKVLKIHLEQHSANDFLRNLEANFCEQIEELWLNTKADAEDPDMTNVLAKFGHLKSLHLAPLSIIKLDLNHLFSVCRNLTEIKRI